MRRAAGHQTQRHYDAVRKRSLAPSHEFDQRGSRVQELLKWIGALAMLTGFALTMGGNPALYAATADMLARKTRWLPRIIWMTAGLALGSTVLFAIFQFVNPNSFVHAVRGRVDDLLLNIWVDLVAGVVFLLAAAGIAAWRILRPTLPVRAPSEPKPDAKPYSYFVIGVSSSIIGFTTLPVMYLTGRVVTSLSHDFVLRGIAYLFFLAALIAPFFALAWVWTKFPGITGKLTETYERVLRWDYRWALVAFLAVAGLVLLAIGIFAHR